MNLKTIWLPISITFVSLLANNNIAQAAYFYPLDNDSQTNLISQINNSGSQNGEIDFLETSSIENMFAVTEKQPKSLDLAYKIRVSTAPQPNSNVYSANQVSSLTTKEVPEPNTISFFAVFLVGMVFSSRRH